MSRKDKIYKNTGVPRNRCGVALSQEWLDNMIKKGEVKNTLDKNDPKSGKFQKGNQLQKRKIGMKYNVIDSVLRTAEAAEVQPHEHLQDMLDDHASGKRELTPDYEFKVSKALTDVYMEAEKIRRSSTIEAAQVLPESDEAINKEILDFLGIETDEETE